jgi:hypothetical protein
MKLNEVKEPNEQNPDTLEIGYKNPAKKSDTRRTRLTLGHLNKLRAIRELRTKEEEEERSHYSVIYARNPGV